MNFATQGWATALFCQFNGCLRLWCKIFLKCLFGGIQLSPICGLRGGASLASCTPPLEFKDNDVICRCSAKYSDIFALAFTAPKNARFCQCMWFCPPLLNNPSDAHAVSTLKLTHVLDMFLVTKHFDWFVFVYLYRTVGRRGNFPNDSLKMILAKQRRRKFAGASLQLWLVTLRMSMHDIMCSF